nr:hypothetical protein [uncultured Methylophaga sp.]
MDDVKISKKEAYLAMYAFLDNYYSLTKSDDIAGLLGELSLLADGGSADPSAKSDWNEALQKALSGKVNAQLQIKNT